MSVEDDVTHFPSRTTIMRMKLKFGLIPIFQRVAKPGNARTPSAEGGSVRSVRHYALQRYRRTSKIGFVHLRFRRFPCGFHCSPSFIVRNAPRSIRTLHRLIQRCYSFCFMRLFTQNVAGNYVPASPPKRKRYFMIRRLSVRGAAGVPKLINSSSPLRNLR
jgi:hypothetical protein